MKKHKKLKIVLFIIAVIIIGLGVAALIYFNRFTPQKDTVNNPVNTLTLTDAISSEKAVADLDYIYDMLKSRHPCYLDGSEFPQKAEVAYNAEKALLEKSENVTICELWRSASRLLKTIGDGHTIARAYNENALYVNDITELKGCTLISIDGVSAKELLADFKTVFSYEPEVEFYADYVFEHEAVLRELYLQLLGIDTSDGVDFEIETANGEKKTLHLTFTTSDKVIGVSASDELEFRTEYDEEKSLAIFAFDEFRVTDEFEQALADFFKTVKEKNIQNIAVDLRNNGGGSTNATLKFMEYIDVDKYLLFAGVDVRNGDTLVINKNEYSFNNRKDDYFSGNVYVLTSNNTFSTAMDFACVFQDNKLGTVIGEIPGNMPSAYGDKLTFQCPESKLVFCISYKDFHRIDESKDALPLIPDYEVDETEVFDKLYELISK